MTTSASTMMKKVERYLVHKRSLGYKMAEGGRRLRSFARYADLHAPGGPLTVNLAVCWASSPKDATCFHHAHRLSTVRVFARYLTVFDSRTEIPPHQLFGSAARRVPPYIYARREIMALIRDVLPGPVNQKHRAVLGVRNATIIGLLACTGMRVGEALALKNREVDLSRNVITVHQSKNLPMRLVPISASASSHLRQYQAVRDQQFGTGEDSNAFFRSSCGGHVLHSTIWRAFRGARNRIGLGPTARRKPRLHDLRHTFACNHLLRAYRENRNIDNAVHDLSIYLGHSSLAETYWYISAVPALFRLCSKRSEALGLLLRKGGLL